MRDWGIYTFSLIFLISLLLAGCAGTLTDVSKQVSEEREKIKKRVGQLYERYESARQVYRSLRTAINDRWDSIPEKLQSELKRFDAKAVEFNEQVEALRSDLQDANSNIKELESMAKDADKRWTELIETLKNISKIAVTVA